MNEIVWLIIAAIFIIAEIISLGLTSIWFAGGAVVAALLAWLGCNTWVQIIGFGVVSLVLLLATRPFVKKHLIRQVEKTNVESYVGRQVMVTREINNSKGEGQAMINDIEWSARSENGSIIPAGKTVVIKAISGVKLIVAEE
jgi:membrane protein implicated in regulation of membrane protease activity